MKSMAHRFRKFILFQREDYEWKGGLEDIVGSFDSMEDAETAAAANELPHTFYIIDRDTWEKVPSLMSIL